MIKIFPEDLDYNVEHIINMQPDTANAFMKAGELDFCTSSTGTQFAGPLEMYVTEEWRDRKKVSDCIHERS